jgi:ribosomal protein L16 Arg81 hydroxylase
MVNLHEDDAVSESTIFPRPDKLLDQLVGTDFGTAYAKLPFAFTSLDPIDPRATCAMIWDVLAATKFSAAGVRLAKRSELFEPEKRTIRGRSFIDPQALIEALQLGQTVNIIGVEKYRPDIRRITDGVEEAFGLPCSANLYISFEGSTGGYGPHRDPHDVVAVHLYGSKIWTVYIPDDPSISLRSTQSSKSEPNGKPWKHTMTSGSVLYVPAGFTHDVESLEGVCIHLTFGLKCLRWHDLLNDLVAELADDALFVRVPRDEEDAATKFECAIRPALMRAFSPLAVARMLDRYKHFSTLRAKKERITQALLSGPKRPGG